MNILPIGTIVMLKDGEKPLMIIGNMQRDGDGKLYDYISVLYPEGFLNSETIFLFNAEDIASVVSEGYKNDECIGHLAVLNELYDNL